MEHLVSVAAGDARSLLNAIELAVETTPDSFPPPDGSEIYISKECAEESIQRRAVLYDKEGDYHFDVISAFIKSLRGSDTDASLYWLARMVAAGEDPRFIFRRMIILAAATFFDHGTTVSSLPEAGALLRPLLGESARTVFALALLLAGVSSTVTSGMAAGSIFAGFYDEPYDIRDVHSRAGVLLSLVLAFVVLLFVGDAFRGLLVSQAVLSVQLPITVFLQVSLTSSRRVMGRYANSRATTVLLYAIASLVTVLNLYLIGSLFTD